MRIGPRRRMPAVVALMCCTLAVFGVAATSLAGTQARPTACSLLADGLKRHVIFALKTRPDFANNAINCSRSDGKPPAKSKWGVQLWFVPYPPGEVARAWKEISKAMRAGKNPAVRLRGFGADDAFAAQGATDGTAGRLSNVGIAWRKGVYLGQLSVTRPSPSSESDEDDIDDAAEILRDSLRRLPRR